MAASPSVVTRPAIPRDRLVLYVKKGGPSLSFYGQVLEETDNWSAIRSQPDLDGKHCETTHTYRSSFNRTHDSHHHLYEE